MEEVVVEVVIRIVTTRSLEDLRLTRARGGMCFGRHGARTDRAHTLLSTYTDKVRFKR